MRKLLILVAILLGGAYAVRGLLGGERGERLARLPATMMERCMEMMPEDSPPMVMMSSLRQLQEQSDELLALLREQGELLRERLRVQETPSQA
ncbi:MAG: hypothetical protein IIC26_00300 [Chloroflexi bacterium]|nr:hypothetical protein [Chloroflexota bacterium]